MDDDSHRMYLSSIPLTSTKRLKEEASENKEAALKREKEEDVVGKIIENATMEIPDPMVDTQVRQMVQEFAQRIHHRAVSAAVYAVHRHDTGEPYRRT